MDEWDEDDPSGHSEECTCETCIQNHPERDQDAQAWDEDEKDMQRIKDEWDAFDRDPPGS